MKPRFTLRDLFWLVLIAGLGLGWWNQRQADDRELRRLDSKYRALDMKYSRWRSGIDLAPIYTDKPLGGGSFRIKPHPTERSVPEPKGKA